MVYKKRVLGGALLQVAITTAAVAMGINALATFSGMLFLVTLALFLDMKA